MAQATTEDERERGAAVDAGSGGGRGGGIPLADEGADELPALLAIAVGIAILFIGMIWPTLRDDATHRGGSGEDAAVVQEDPETVEEEPETAEEPETVEEDPALELPDVPAIQGLLDTELAGLNASADGRVVTLSGVVPDAATAEALVAQVAAQPNVDSVDNQLEIAPAAGAAVTATAAQVSIVLEGTVPDEATREAIVARAIEVYSEAQVDDQLVVDDSVGSPVSITLTGSMTDPVLYDQVQAAFADLDGVELSEWKTSYRNDDGKIRDGLWAVGWAKRGPSGVIATNRKDSTEVAHKLLEELGEGRPGGASLDALLRERGVRVVSFEDWERIDAAEVEGAEPASRRKITRIADMLAVLDG